MNTLKQYELWFVTGSQHLYGEEPLRQVQANAETIVQALNAAEKIPLYIVRKPLMTHADAIHALMMEANATPACAGIVAWMHTFSPAKMWLKGLQQLHKPLLHLHTQFKRDIPWEDIDMDYMNLNQSAHGGREFGFIASRLRIPRKVVVGHWEDDAVRERIGHWSRAAAAYADLQHTRIARFGDNMRNVAVTEGDKVAAKAQLGFSVEGFGIGDLKAYIDQVTQKQRNELIQEYQDTYRISGNLSSDNAFREGLHQAACIELGMKTFLEEGHFSGFTTTFENLHGLRQLPGLAVQRLMEAGYGFGAEGDWKTAALVHAMKGMAEGLSGGTSFMEDYTYHLKPGEMKVLGAHMLEVCPSLAQDTPSLEIHPLDIGGKEDPARLVFNVSKGSGLNAALMDMGDRFRLLVNTLEVVETRNLPNLPVARAVWEPRPDLKTAAEAWILAGGAHHTAFTQSLQVEHLEDFAEMLNSEFLLIDENTQIRQWKKELKWNDLYYHLANGFHG